jgi:hypothetical protein
LKAIENYQLVNPDIHTEENVRLLINRIVDIKNIYDDVYYLVLEKDNQ